MKHIEFECSKTKVLLRGRIVPAIEQNKPAPVVIMLTGDGPKGSKSLSWTNLPPKLAERGIASFLFDFEGLGYSDGERRSLSLTKGIFNLESAFSALLNEAEIDSNNIGALASSFGASALLCSSDIANKMKCIGLKSPAAFLPDAYYKEIGEQKFNEWRAEGFLEENGYDFSIFLDSLLHNAFSSSAKIKTPCLITQGSADEVIPVQQTTYLYECLQSENKKLEIFPGASHGYSENNAWDRMASMFVNWFSSHLITQN